MWLGGAGRESAGRATWRSGRGTRLRTAQKHWLAGSRIDPLPRLTYSGGLSVSSERPALAMSAKGNGSLYPTRFMLAPLANGKVLHTQCVRCAL